MLTEIIIDGEKKSVHDYMILSLLNIPHTMFNMDYWEKDHLESLSFDLECVTCPMFDATVSLGDENEVHQIDAMGVHHFSISKHRWGMWPTRVGR